MSYISSALLEVGGASVNAALSIWQELEEAGVSLLSKTGDTTTLLLEHKFGNQVGDLSRETFASGVNIFQTVRNVRRLTLPSVAKKFAQEAGKKVAIEIIRKNDGDKETIQIVKTVDGKEVAVEVMNKDDINDTFNENSKKNIKNNNNTEVKKEDEVKNKDGEKK